MILTQNSKIHPSFHEFVEDMSKETNKIQFKNKLNILFPTEYILHGSKMDEEVGSAAHDSHIDTVKLYKR